MSLVFNMVGGGGGKLKDTDAVLIVTVSTGSTVTTTKGDIILTPTMWVKAADQTLDCAIFSIPASQFDSTNPWTVTATLGTKIASATVLISENAEYDIELSYGFYLYNNGNQYTAVTGGWSYAEFLDAGYYSVGNLNTAYNGTTCYLSASGPQKQISAVTVNKIDVTNYNSLRIEVSNYTFVDTGYRNLSLVSSRGGVSSPAAQVQISSTGIYAVDISTITGSYYIGLYLNSGTSGDCYIGFTRLFLER